MDLLTLEEYSIFLKKEFAEIDPELLEGLFVKPFHLDDNEVLRAEKELKMGDFPSDFTALIKKHDFGNLRINNIQFGSNDTGSLDWLLRKNNPENFGYKDFVSELRKQSLIVVANGDPFTILMHIKTANIFAINAELEISERLPVADSFNLFVEGAGTGFVAKRNKSMKEFLELAYTQFGKDAFPFWKEATL
jgi:hypothetical protein